MLPIFFHLTATIGVGLSPCDLPGTGPSFDLPEGMMELGLGKKRVRTVSLCVSSRSLSPFFSGALSFPVTCLFV